MKCRQCETESVSFLDLCEAHVTELQRAAAESAARAEQYERDWYDAKSEFGDAMAKARARIAELEKERDHYLEEANRLGKANRQMWDSAVGERAELEHLRKREGHLSVCSSLKPSHECPVCSPANDLAARVNDLAARVNDLAARVNDLAARVIELEAALAAEKKP